MRTRDTRSLVYAALMNPLLCAATVVLFGMQLLSAQDNLFSDETATLPVSPKTVIQNAVLEGIQIVSEPADIADEDNIICYFIFRDKPSSYFYETKQQENAIVFEFNDVQLGSSPIPSVKLSPIQGFKIKQERVDANKDVVGLNPDWHDITKVMLYFDAIPQISVKDEYSVISFSFRWSSDPQKVNQYTKKEKSNKPLIYSLVGGGLALGGAGAYLYFKGGDDNQPPQPLSHIKDEIIHPDPNK